MVEEIYWERKRNKKVMKEKFNVRLVNHMWWKRILQCIRFRVLDTNKRARFAQSLCGRTTLPNTCRRFMHQVCVCCARRKLKMRFSYRSISWKSVRTGRWCVADCNFRTTKCSVCSKYVKNIDLAAHQSPYSVFSSPSSSSSSSSLSSSSYSYSSNDPSQQGTLQSVAFNYLRSWFGY